MYDEAEDLIDKFLVHVKLQRDNNKVGRLFNVSHITTVRALAAETKGICDKVKKLGENHQHHNT
ncbi:hypothetical protein MTR67_016187 [Solanum verrucosum]|uniref:Uncharacterized protein n=1 Tax=Solanum verrucosum TaxID=315347 RepID=A0AAF0QHA2_SOLVR|nr:hypothetical protein MTR67_016187 [Solanum verrucosum]